MSYNTHTWQNGDIITAAKMNEMEQGISIPNLAIYKNGNTLWLTDGYRSTRIADIVSQIVCFRGDTTYITMYDGTKKLIKDVKFGDEVLGYDVNRKEYVKTVVIENIMTGIENGFHCYVMDDGTTIDIHNDDSFITHHRTKQFGDKDGDFIGLHSIKQLLKWHEDVNEVSRKIIKDTGNLENTTGVIWRKYLECAEPTPRYVIYTANGTVFVNGLLSAQSPQNTIRYFKQANIQVPENIEQLWDGIIKRFAAYDEGLPDDHIQHPEKVGDIEILERAKILVQANKDYLASTDYKAMKFAEGAITEEEWLPIKTQRAAARAIVNEQEAIVEEYKTKVASNNPEFIYDVGQYPWKREYTIWKENQGLLDAHAEDFRAWCEAKKDT